MSTIENDERGAVAVEFAVLGGALIVAFFTLMLFAGQVQQQENGVRAAAHGAARAASLRDNPAEAADVAQATATTNLRERDVSCESPAISVTFDPPVPTPGGLVLVTVTCSTSVNDFNATASYTAVEVIDVYRTE
jgi:Flp pilus assembly protein TadG